VAEGAEGARGIPVLGSDDDPTPAVQQHLAAYRAAVADLLRVLPKAPRELRRLASASQPRDTPRDTPRDSVIS
jgi:hypothetical protein